MLISKPYFSSSNAILLNRPLFLLLFFLFFSMLCSAQHKWAVVSGKVVDEEEQIIPNVSVEILGNQRGITTNDSGLFSLKVPAEKAFALVFSYTGYKTTQQNFLMAESEREQVTIRLEKASTTLQEVTVADNR